MKKPNTFIVAAAVTAAVIAAFWLLLVAPGLTGNQINMTRGVTALSASHYHLHMIILWICVVIGVIVFSAMFVSIVLHRKSRGHEPARFTHSTKAEITWTVIPVLILVAMAVPATRALITRGPAGSAVRSNIARDGTGIKVTSRAAGMRATDHPAGPCGPFGRVADRYPSRRAPDGEASRVRARDSEVSCGPFRSDRTEEEAWPDRHSCASRC